MTDKELEIVKGNISNFIMNSYIEVDQGFKILGETSLKSFNFKKEEIKDRIQKNLTDLNMKIKKELIN